MTFEERKLLAKINSLFGNLLFISDNVSDYSPEQLEALKDAFAKKDVEIYSAGFAQKDIMEIIYAENGEAKRLCFNIRTGEQLS